MYHYRKNQLLAGAGALPLDLERKDDSGVMAGIKTAIESLGTDFEEFKKANNDRLAELSKKGSADVMLEEKVKKIGDNLDKISEAKAALEKRLDAEKKEREELELRLARTGEGKAGDDFETELKQFNVMLEGHAAERKQAYEPLNADGYVAYKAAFGKFMRKDNRLLSVDEIKTLSVGSDPDGGYLVTPDTSGRIVKKVYETSEMRQIAAVQPIGTDKLEGIEDLGEAGAGYAGEHSTSGDVTTPQIGKWSIPVWIIDTEPKATQQLLDDANVDVEAWLAAKVADKLARFENAQFITGAAKIRGITSYTTAADSGAGVTWGTIGHVVTGTSGAFGATVATQADKLFDVMGLLKNAYLPNAKWVTNRAVITLIRKFKIAAATDAYAWQPGLVLGVPDKILGHDVVRMEDMPTVAADSLSLAFGDFSAAYQIVDRQGIRVLRDPYTAKPYVKFYTTKRTGGGVVNFEALKFLKFGT